MADPSTIAGLASSLASATTISKTLLGMKVDGEVREAIAALQNDLISAQSAALESLADRDKLYRRIQELEAKLEEGKRWSETAAEYDVYETSSALAYRPRKEGSRGLYCPKCFENKRLSRLQEDRPNRGGHFAHCLQCQTSLQFEQSPPIRIDDDHY